MCSWRLAYNDAMGGACVAHFAMYANHAGVPPVNHHGQARPERGERDGQATCAARRRIAILSPLSFAGRLDLSWRHPPLRDLCE